MQFDGSTRPVWAEVNLDHLVHNIREVKRSVLETTLVTAVIKADGYGHGAVEIGQTLLDNGADRFAVATLSEAIQLRHHFRDVPIMVLGYTPITLHKQILDHQIIQTIYTYEQAESLNKVAATLKSLARVHIKIDTGMRRLGMPVDETTVKTILKMNALKNLEIEGIFTHFAVADERDKSFTNLQVSRFMEVVSELEKAGLAIPIKHVSNSAGIIDCPEYQFDMVRAGIMLYGLYPSKEVDHTRIRLKEVMSLKAEIAQVKWVESGEGISYGLKYKAGGPSQIATLPLGYADGYSRLLSFKAQAIVKGQVKPIVGRICMDQCMMEVNGLDVASGDCVTLFGKAGALEISIDTVAQWLGTINYEVVCMIGKRVPRRYISQGQVVHNVDYNLKNMV
jgi:alanine racemase